MRKMNVTAKMLNSTLSFTLLIGFLILSVNSVSATEYPNDVYPESGNTYVSDIFKGDVKIIGVHDVTIMDSEIDGNLFIEDAENIYLKKILMPTYDK